MMFSKYFRILFVALIVGLFASQGVTASPPRPKEATEAQKRELNQFLARWNDQRHRNILNNAGWTLIHNYSDLKRVNRALHALILFEAALERYQAGDYAAFAPLGGLKGFKDSVAGWLTDKEPSVRSYAALFLGVSGDRAYAGQIARSLKARRTRADYRTQYDRNRAAMALGLMQAQEYKAVLVTMLNAPSEYDRAGAIYGLAYMNAKDQELAIGRLLYDKNDVVRDAAEQALEIMQSN